MRLIGKLITVCGICAALLCGCSKQPSERGVTTENAVNNALSEQMAKEDAQTATEAPTTEATTEATTESTTEKTTETTTEATTTEENTTELTASASTDGVDVDLTTMNSDMVYSTVYQMMVDPFGYEGKVIRVSGNFVPVWYEPTQQYYEYCLIADAVGCCQQGLEFVWDDGSHVYPDDYPAEDTMITVTGTFETYKDNPDDEMMFCRLANATMEIDDAATDADIK